MARVADCVYWVDGVVFLCMLTYACKIVILCRKLGNLEKKKSDAGNNFHIGYCLFFLFLFFGRYSLIIMAKKQAFFAFLAFF